MIVGWLFFQWNCVIRRGRSITRLKRWLQLTREGSKSLCESINLSRAQIPRRIVLRCVYVRGNGSWRKIGYLLKSKRSHVCLRSIRVCDKIHVKIHSWWFFILFFYCTTRCRERYIREIVKKASNEKAPATRCNQHTLGVAEKIESHEREVTYWIINRQTRLLVLFIFRELCRAFSISRK